MQLEGFRMFSGNIIVQSMDSFEDTDFIFLKAN